jgi:hypothetical protein
MAAAHSDNWNDRHKDTTMRISQHANQQRLSSSQQPMTID